MRVVGVLQARLGSTRLPGKVLRELGGVPMVERIRRRMERSMMLDEVIVAIPEGDDALHEYLHVSGISHYAGQETDLIDRILKAGQLCEADAIVRITADCPCVSWELIDACVTLLVGTGVEYVSNVEPPLFPDGLDVEVYSMSLLERLWQEATGVQREWFPHLVWGTEVPRLNVALYDQTLSRARLTVDHEDDLRLVERIYDELGAWFGFRELVGFLGQHPELLEINGRYSTAYLRGAVAPHDRAFFPEER